MWRMNRTGVREFPWILFEMTDWLICDNVLKK